MTHQRALLVAVFVTGLAIVSGCGSAARAPTTPPAEPTPGAATSSPQSQGSAFVPGDGGAGIDALNTALEAAKGIDDVMADTAPLLGDVELTTVAVPEKAVESVAPGSTWLSMRIPDSVQGRYSDAAAWRAYLAIGLLRDTAAARGWAVPGGVSIDMGAGGVGNSTTVLPEPGSLERPVLSGLPLPNSVSEADRTIRSAVARVDSVSLISLDFVSSASAVPIVVASTNDPAQALGTLRSLDLGDEVIDYEGWWFELHGPDDSLVFVSAVSRRLGRGSTWVAPQFESAWRAGGHD